MRESSDGDPRQSLEQFGAESQAVTVVDEEYGCKYTQQIDISDETCKNEFGSQQWNNCLFIPSVFTPNSDGINDLWDIYNIELYEPDVTVKIFNRWGQLVYESEGSYEPWDGVGLLSLNNQEIATYYYVINLQNGDDVFKGAVTIVR